MNKYEFWDWIRLGIVLVIGFWIGWALTSYTVDVIKRNRVVWTNMKVVDGVYNKVMTNDVNSVNSIIKSNEVVILGLRRDGVVIWRVK